MRRTWCRCRRIGGTGHEKVSTEYERDDSGERLTAAAAKPFKVDTKVATRRSAEEDIETMVR